MSNEPTTSNPTDPNPKPKATNTESTWIPTIPTPMKKIKATEVQNPEPADEELRDKLRAQANQGTRKKETQPLPDANPKPENKDKKDDPGLGSQLLASAKQKLLPDFFSVPEEEKSANRKKFDQLPLGKKILVAFLWNDNIPGGKTLAKSLFPKVHPKPSEQKDIDAALTDPTMKKMFEEMNKQGLSVSGQPTGKPATFTFKADPNSPQYKALNPDQQKALKGVEIKVSPDMVACNKIDKNNCDAFTKTVAAFNKARGPDASPLTVTGQKPEYETKLSESAARTGIHSVVSMTPTEKAKQTQQQQQVQPQVQQQQQASGPKIGQHRSG